MQTYQTLDPEQFRELFEFYKAVQRNKRRKEGPSISPEILHEKGIQRSEYEEFREHFDNVARTFPENSQAIMEMYEKETALRAYYYTPSRKPREVRDFLCIPEDKAGPKGMNNKIWSVIREGTKTWSSNSPYKPEDKNLIAEDLAIIVDGISRIPALMAITKEPRRVASWLFFKAGSEATRIYKTSPPAGLPYDPTKE